MTLFVLILICAAVIATRNRLRSTPFHCAMRQMLA